MKGCGENKTEPLLSGLNFEIVGRVTHTLKNPNPSSLVIVTWHPHTEQKPFSLQLRVYLSSHSGILHQLCWCYGATSLKTSVKFADMVAKSVHGKIIFIRGYRSYNEIELAKQFCVYIVRHLFRLGNAAISRKH